MVVYSAVSGYHSAEHSVSVIIIRDRPHCYPYPHTDRIDQLGVARLSELVERWSNSPAANLAVRDFQVSSKDSVDTPKPVSQFQVLL